MLIRAFFQFFLVFLIVWAETSVASSQTCRWDGTAPFCDGSCGGGETEVTRLGGIPDHWIPPYVTANPPFGESCVTGSKALCCKTRGVVCRWDGTAPFCAGSCRSGETRGQPPDNSSSGSACVTGEKVYCCRSEGTVVSVGQRLETDKEYVRYAALWQKTSGAPWQARHGLTAAQYQQTFDELVSQGYRLVYVNGYAVSGQALYAAIFEQSPGPAWVARHNLTGAEYQQEFDRLVQQGYRPVEVSGYEVDGADRYAAIFEQRTGSAWIARHNLTSSQYQAEFDRLAGEGYRLAVVSGYSIGGQDRYAAIWEKSDGPAWAARHGMNSSQYQQAFNELAAGGYRLIRLSAWENNGSSRFAAIWNRADGPDWQARHGLISQLYQEVFDEFVRDGFRLVNVSGYETSE
jgi:hypothetical protein